MKKIYDKCYGIDVHKKLLAACFIHGREQEVREFGTTTREILSLIEWLLMGGCPCFRGIKKRQNLKKLMFLGLTE